MHTVIFFHLPWEIFSLLLLMGSHDLTSSSPKLVPWTVPCQDWRSTLVQPSPVFGHFTLQTDQTLYSWLTGFKLGLFVASTEVLKLNLICPATFRQLSKGLQTIFYYIQNKPPIGISNKDDYTGRQSSFPDSQGHFSSLLSNDINMQKDFFLRVNSRGQCSEALIHPTVRRTCTRNASPPPVIQPA